MKNKKTAQTLKSTASIAITGGTVSLVVVVGVVIILLTLIAIAGVVSFCAASRERRPAMPDWITVPIATGIMAFVFFGLVALIVEGLSDR